MTNSSFIYVTGINRSHATDSEGREYRIIRRNGETYFAAECKGNGSSSTVYADVYVQERVVSRPFIIIARRTEPDALDACVDYSELFPSGVPVS